MAQVMGGVDSSTPAHLVDESRWVQHHNVRPFRGGLTQLAHKVQLGQVTEQSTELQLLATLSTGNKDEALAVALTRNKVLQLRPAAPASGVVLTQADGSAFTVINGSEYFRWSSTIYNRRLYFTNPWCALSETDGCYVKQLSAPAARYVETWFDHMVLGWTYRNNEERPTQVRISHLYDFETWDAADTNEADLIDIEEFQRTDYPLLGVTGLRRWKDMLLIYTPTAILAAQYVGLPKVLQWGPLVTDVGNSLKYGLASHGLMHFFYDGNEQDFYMFDGVAAKPIGGPILGYWASTLHSDFEYAQRTWAFTRPEYQEVTWVFCSTTSGGLFDKAITFNWRTGTWYTSNVENIHSIGGQFRRAKSIDELTGSIDSKSGTLINNLSATGESYNNRLFGSNVGRVFREEVSADATATLVDNIASAYAVGSPVLETRDMYGADPRLMKEVDSLAIQASYGGDSTGIQVYVSARNNLTDAVSYTLVGTWTPTLEQGRLTFSAQSGKIFRFKFVPNGTIVRDFVWKMCVPDALYNGAEQ
jgi:hypothetical protein